MILLGIGLGVISGSALKLLAPQVRQQQLALPEWLAKQPWIDSITLKAAMPSNTGSDSAAAKAPLAPLRNTGLPQHPFAPRQEIPALSQR
ncbi:MAG: serine hydrolase, partial [Synechococcus sp. BS307-5m-G35]|nr:serine hydrolase [Synechococcus sp. BS307-5m-G35]